jgi:hypothetical protein
VEEDWKREIEEGEKGREREKRETWTGGSLEGKIAGPTSEGDAWRYES